MRCGNCGVAFSLTCGWITRTVNGLTHVVSAVAHLLMSGECRAARRTTGLPLIEDIFFLNDLEFQ